MTPSADPQHTTDANSSPPVTHYRMATVDGIDIFHREAGPANGPAIVLLHGFPTSSHMFRNLIPSWPTDTMLSPPIIRASA